MTATAAAHPIRIPCDGSESLPLPQDGFAKLV